MNKQAIKVLLCSLASGLIQIFRRAFPSFFYGSSPLYPELSSPGFTTLVEVNSQQASRDRIPSPHPFPLKKFKGASSRWTLNLFDERQDEAGDTQKIIPLADGIQTAISSPPGPQNNSQ